MSRRRPPPIPAGARRPTPFSKVLAPIVEAADVEHAEAIREWNAFDGEKTKLDPPDGFEAPTPVPVLHVPMHVEETTPPVAIDSLAGYQIGRLDGRLEGATIVVRETRAMFVMGNNSPEFVEKMTAFLTRRMALLGIVLPPPDRIDSLTSYTNDLTK